MEDQDYETQCPYHPSSEEFSLRRCETCRSTTPLGYNTRKTVMDRVKALKQKLAYPCLYNGYYNFECPYFPWNYKKELRIESEVISLEGTKPPKPEECPYHKEATCEKLRISTMTTLRLSGGRIYREGSIPVCELCLVGSSYTRMLLKLFGIQDDLA